MSKPDSAAPASILMGLALAWLIASWHLGPMLIALVAWLGKKILFIE